MDKFIVCFWILTIAFTGCKSRRVQPLPTPPSSLTCDDIVDRSLMNSTLWQAQGAAIGQWIRTHFNDADLSGVGDGPDYSWRKDDRVYVALRSPPNAVHVSEVNISLTPYPRISDVLRCFGPPKSYYFGPALDASDAPLMLILWYPEKGLALYQIGIGVTEIKANPASILLTDVLLTLPGDEKSMAMKIYLEPFATKIKMRSYLWPKRVQDLRFTADR